MFDKYADWPLAYAEEIGRTGDRAEQARRETEREMARNFQTFGAALPAEDQ